MNTSTCEPLRSPAATLKECHSCRNRIRASANRCSLCGARLQVGAVHKSAPAAAGGLTDLHKEILLAASNGPEATGAVLVTWPRAGVEGEIKAGSRRMYGNAAVEAIERLTDGGFLVRRAPSAFRLTERGRQLVDLVRRVAPPARSGA